MVFINFNIMKRIEKYIWMLRYQQIDSSYDLIGNFINAKTQEKRKWVEEKKLINFVHNQL